MKFNLMLIPTKAISPVIATILLLAITVIIAVGVFQFLNIYTQEQFTQTENNQILDDFNTRVIDTNPQETIIQTPFPELNVTRVLLDGFECDGNIGIISSRPLRINLSSCSSSVTTTRPRLTIETEDGIIQRDLDSRNFGISTGSAGTDGGASTVTDTNCFNPDNVGSIGVEEPCIDMLIVNNSMLRAVASSCIFSLCPNGDETFQIQAHGRIFTFEDSQDNIFTGQVTDLNSLFWETVFNGNINYWDVRNVTDMGSMFRSASEFDQPLDNWDVSNVASLFETFMSASNFNQPLNEWDTSNVTVMIGTFSGSNFNQPLNEWDTSNVLSMTTMFSAGSFNQNISCWDVSSLISSPPALFGSQISSENLPIWGTDGSSC